MNDYPLISIIIVSRDRPALLPRALKSVFEQDYRPIEIILVDNQSRESLKSPETPDGVSVKLIKTPFLMNSSQSRNLGIDQTQGELIGFLDDDDYFMPGKIKKQAKAFVEDPALKIVFMNTQIISSNGHNLSVLRGTDYYPLMKNVHLNGLLVRREVVQQEHFDERMTRDVDDHFTIRIFDRYPWRHIDEVGAVWNYERRKDQITYHSKLTKFRSAAQKYINSKIMCEDFSDKIDQNDYLRQQYYSRHAKLALARMKPLEAFRYWRASRG